MNPYVEILGTFSSIVVAVSLTMRNIRWLRTVNLIGALFFSVYGLLIQAWPVFGLNAFIVLINVFYLVQLALSRDTFSVLQVNDPVTDPLLQQFLAHHRADILKFQPDFGPQALVGSHVVFVLREVLPVSLFVCREEGDQSLRILLDYAIPAWRDFRSARFFFSQGFRDLDWGKSGTFVADTTVKAHARYLRALGFVSSGDTPQRWVRETGGQ